MSAESVQFAEMVRIEHARIERLKQAANVPFWMKQGGGYPNKRDKLEDMPVDLRIRELPYLKEQG